MRESHCNCKAYEYDGQCSHSQEEDRARDLKVRQLVKDINVCDQRDISKLKEEYPGYGVGPIVQERLTKMIRIGLIDTAGELPEEYRKQLSPLLATAC